MSTSQGLGIIGAAVGAWVGGPAGAQWGYAIGSTVGSIIDPEVIKGPDLGDAKQQTSQAGIPIVKVYGMPAPFAGTLIDGDQISRKYTTKEQQGKGGPVVETEGFKATRAILVCEGEVDYARIWRNNKLVYSTIAGDALDPDSANFLSQARLYRGTETQLPDPSLEALHGVGNTPYYRGRAYMVVIDDDETQSGGAANQYLFQVTDCADITPAIGPMDVFAWPTDTTIAGLKQSPDTVAWSSLAGPGISHAGTLLFAGGGRLFLIGSGVGWMSHDRGANWVSITGIVNLTPNGMTYYEHADRYTIVYASGAAASTSIGGTAFVDIAVDSRTYYSPAIKGEVVVVGSTNGEMMRSDDGGGAFGAAFNVSGGTIGHMYQVATAENFISFKRLQDNVWSSPSGEPGTWTQNTHALTGLTGSFGGVAFGGGGVLALAQTGECMFSVDGITGWVQGATIPGFSTGNGISNNLTWDDSEQVFVAVGSEQQIWTTANQGDAWVERVSATGSAQAYEWVVYLAPGGIQLPDAPGYYVDTDGNQSGPSGASLVSCGAVWRDIALDIAARTPCPTSKLDVANMDDEVPGFILARADLSGNDYLRALCGPYFATLPEYDGQLHAIRFGGASVATITADDLLEIEDDDDNTRKQVIEAPARVTLAYPDPANNYVVTPQTARRSVPDIQSTGEKTVQTVIPFTADQSAQIADKMQKVDWTRVQGGFTRALTAKWSKLVPSDAITWTDGQRYIIDRARYEDSMITIECTHDRISDYQSSVSGANAPAPTGQTSNTKGPTILAAMNLPRLRSQDSTPGMYLAAQGLLPGWAGADIYLSVDGGVSEQLVATILDPSVFGELTADCTGSSEPIAVDVYVGGAIDSVTPAQIDAKQNAFAITTSAVSEVGQVQTATEGAERQYDLTDLVRGGLGTTAAAHSTGDTFVMLDHVTFLPLDIGLSGKTLIFRAVSRGTPAANNATFSVVFDPQFTGPQDVEPITVSGVPITVSGQQLLRILPDA